jgi:hypothetical protein
MKFILILILTMAVQACSYNPQLTFIGDSPQKVLLGYSYGDLLLEIYEDNVDSSWSLEQSKTTIDINGSVYKVATAIREEYITEQGGFACFIYLNSPKHEEGVYVLDATITKDGIYKTYKSTYKMEYKFSSVFHYFYAIYM